MQKMDKSKFKFKICYFLLIIQLLNGARLLSETSKFFFVVKYRLKFMLFTYKFIAEFFF